METARKGERDKAGGKVRSLSSNLSTFLSPAPPPLKGAGLLLYLVLWASLPGPEAFAFLTGTGWIEWRVGRLMGMGHCPVGPCGWGSSLVCGVGPQEAPCSDYSLLFKIPCVATIDELKVALRVSVSRT